MSDIKSFILKKVVPGEVYMAISPMSNPSVSRTVHLTDHAPQQVLPLDWALGVVMDQGNYSLYKKGVITFDNNDALAKAAVENGVWFDVLDFQPASEDQAAKVLAILKAGNRANIKNAIDRYSKDFVAEVASYHVEELTTAVVTMLETLLQTQLTVD